MDFTSKLAPFGSVAFSEIALTKVMLSQSFMSIGSAVFVKCYGITSVILSKIPAKITKIDSNAFHGCS